jgi:LuxR family transcriptional regulator, maltose regulon positive regulatory protein
MSKPPKPPAALGKLAPPRLGCVFARDRLFAVLDALSNHPAIWLHGAPGAGKSTLAATWLQARKRNVLWLQLDAGDADPATLVESLDGLVAAAAGAAIELPMLRADDLTDLDAWLRRRFRRLLQHLPPPWVLVFDNQQELPAGSPLQAALAQVLAELPLGVQWLFISREGPPPAFARALAQQQLALFDADDLRFDAAEVQALALLHGRPEAAPALASAQGWAAGMTLMLLGLPHGATVPTERAREHLFDYFAEEVLLRLPQDELQVLYAAAYLPGSTGDMAAELSGVPCAGVLLERLAAHSLFTDRRGSQTDGCPSSITFVFHALFSEFLRRRFERTHTAAERHTLLRRAGALLVRAGQIDAGLQRLMQAESWREVTAILLDSAPDYVARGRVDALRQHIINLPQTLQVPLLYWRGLCALDTDPAAALLDLEAAYEHSVLAAVSSAVSSADASATASATAQLQIAAAAAVALVALSRVKDLDRWLAVMDRHAALAAQVQAESMEACTVPGLLAAVVYRAPWHPLADALAARAERLLHRESAPGQRTLLGSLALHLLWRGQVDRLERVLLRIDALSAQSLASPLTLMRWWSVGVLVKTLLGQHEAARADADQALALVAREPSLAAQRTAAELQRMIVAIACRDAAAARLHLQRASATLHPDHAVERATLEGQRGMLALLEDDRPTALRLARAAVVSAREGGLPMREHIALINHALAAAHSGEHEEAAGLVAAVFAHPFHALCVWHHWVGGMVAAYVALQRGDEANALQRLRGALASAQAHGYRYGPMLYAASGLMPRLAALALAHGIHADVVRDIVLRHDLAAPPGTGDSWPWAVTVRALGGWLIERADGPMPSSRKESRRLLELLQLLVAHCGTPVPQDVVTDALWPDAEGDAARNALDNALHRLRKWLGGDDRILVRQGALSLNSARCWTDVAALESALVSALKPGTTPPLDDASAVLRPATPVSWQHLYPGPLLPGNDAAVVAARRTALHRRVQQALTTFGESLPDL